MGYEPVEENPAMTENVKMAGGVITDVVCPVCFKPLPYPKVLPQGIDKEGREIRTYFGWCFEHRGFAVVQFKRRQRWIIHKYRSYDLTDKTAIVAGVEVKCCELKDDWVILNELPKAENCLPKTAEEINAGTMDALIEMYKAMKSCCVTIESLIENMAAKRGQSIDD
jgi:hypothetical protein